MSSDRNFSDSKSPVSLSRYTRTGSQGHGPVRSNSHKQESTDRNQINQSILTQLNANRDRLSKIENSNSMSQKKLWVVKNKSKVSQSHGGGGGATASGNCVSPSVRLSVSATSMSIPPPASVRQNVRVQQAVQAMLRELNC